MPKITADPSLAQEALKSASEFGESKSGLLSAVPMLKQLGGENIIDDTVKKLNAHPKLKLAINGMLMMKGTSINGLASELNGQGVVAQQVARVNKTESSNASLYMNRLKNLK
jgi:hypothetical protein